MDLGGEGFEAGAGVEVEYLYAGALFEQGLVAGEPHIYYLFARRDGCFYEGDDKGGEVVDAVNLPDDVITFSEVV